MRESFRQCRRFIFIFAFMGGATKAQNLFSVPSPLSEADSIRCYAAKGVNYEPQNGNFSPVNAHALALLSMVAYQDKATAESLAKLLGFDTAELLEADRVDWGNLSGYRDPNAEENGQEKAAESIQAEQVRAANTSWMVAHTYLLFASKSDMAVLAYRGTDLNHDMLPNLVTDLQVNQVPFGENGSVHSGFYGATRIIWDQVTRMLNSVGKPVPLFVAGHSLGAGLGTVTAVNLFQDYTRHLTKLQSDATITWDTPFVQGLYTFGSPRVGNQEFVDAFTRHLYEMRSNPVMAKPSLQYPEGLLVQPSPYSARFVNNHDIVSRIPDPFSYRHIDEPKYWDDAGNFYQDSKAQKKLYWQNILVNLFDFKNDEIEDHRIQLYVEKTYQLVHGAPSGCI